MQVRSTQNKDESADLRAVAPLIGRYEELELMRAHWQTANDGRGQMVVISGESGIGTSRLGKHVVSNIVDANAEKFRYQC